MTTWRDDPKVQTIHWSHAVESMEIAVAAYKRWLTSEIEKMPAESNDFGYPALLQEDVLALIEQEDKA